MAIVPNADYDIFISYAHSDNVPIGGASEGWVTTFVKSLQAYTELKLGGKELTLWMDYELKGHEPLTPAILDALKKSATLVVFLSPSYLKSDWCRREREAFLGFIKQGLLTGSRIFIVECEEVKREEYPNYPPEFTDLTGFRFLAPEQQGKQPRRLNMPPIPDDDRLYYGRLHDLSVALAGELKKLRREGAPVVRDAAPPPAADFEGEPPVFLAEVTEDLDPLRQEVKSYLEQVGLKVLPETWYPRDDLAAFRHAVERDLQLCRLFVQLLGATAGRKRDDLPRGYAHYQYECALRAGKAIMQWRPQDLNVVDVTDAGHRELLLGGTVRASGIGEFKRAVIEEARRASQPPPTPPGGAFIFVNSDSPDYVLAEEVAGVLQKHEVAYAIPISEGSPSDLRADLEDNLRSCDGLIVIYGGTTVNWVRNQLRQGRKIMSQRDEPLRALAIYEGPPAPKSKINLSLPGMRTLNCHNGLDEAVLLKFLHSLGGKSDG